MPAGKYRMNRGVGRQACKNRLDQWLEKGIFQYAHGIQVNCPPSPKGKEGAEYELLFTV